MHGSKLVTGVSNRCSPKDAKLFMNYFNLYYAYLAQCERENRLNMRDPNHDYMEWNHTLPQCIFGDLPFGQWLTLKQHSIASALQTLAYKHRCVCGWHKSHVPSPLWNLCQTYYKGVHNNQFGKPHTREIRLKISENRKGICPPRAKEHNQKISKANKGKKYRPRTDEEKELLSKIFSGEGNPRYGVILDESTKQKISNTKKVKFRCLVTNRVSNSTGLTKIQNSLGIDTSLREQIN